ncbi:MAG: ATP-binding protein, partial [Daejeonella sp.]|uniref:ATP-binding protein n=1 Tax=Daejeonella sp. TaxID=2805397 RepID=UPI003C77D964
LNELKEPVSLTALLSTIRTSIKNIIEQENVDFNLSGIQVDEIYSLRSYMHSIFLNLVTNSIKYRRPNQLLKIAIDSSTENEKLTIRYKDNGRGIDLDKHGDNVFGLYKRFHRDIEGKGVGLFMIKTQTEILGGKVELLSAVDEGVEFTFEFNL